jgi:hypothetical protein
MHRLAIGVVAALTCVAAGSACQLRRPNSAVSRMIEPTLVESRSIEPAGLGSAISEPRPIRLLETQASAHIGRRLLHQQADGELTEDPVWLWSTTPDRYFDRTLRLVISSGRMFQLIERADVPTLAATLVAWQLDSDGAMRLVGAVEFQFTGSDRVVHTHLVRESEPLMGALPGDLAPASGRLLRRLATAGLANIAQE